MAILTRTALKALWVTAYTPTESDYDNVWDSFEKSWQTATLSASSETSMKVKYAGDVEPTLTKTAAGEYRLDIAAGVTLKGFHWQKSGGTLTGSGSVKLAIRDAGSNYLMGVFQVYSDTNGDEAPATVTRKQTKPAGGDVLLEVSNIGGITGDWIIVGAISI